MARKKKDKRKARIAKALATATFPKPPPPVSGSKAVIKVNGQPVAWATGVIYSTNHITIPTPVPLIRNPLIFMGGISTYSVYSDPLAFDKHVIRKKRLGPVIEFMRLLRKLT